MSRTIAFENVYMTYIDNWPYQYPSRDIEHTITQSNTLYDYEINTGWHIIPNFLWRHYVIPRQWDSLVRECEAYQVKGVECTVYNPIPITTNISLQRVSLFSAFNNCTYALTYTDNKYETDWFPWTTLPKDQQLYLSQREGIIFKGNQLSSSSSGTYTSSRYSWPIYSWRKPNMLTVLDNVWSQGKTGNAGVHNVQTGSISEGKLVSPSGLFWDPFNCPDEIGELRAGKNAVTYNWSIHPCDEGRWFNLDALAAYTMWSTDGPYCGVGRPGTRKETTNMDPNVASTYGLAQARESGDAGSAATQNADYTIPNFAHLPLCPTKWFWKEVQSSIADWYGDDSETARNTKEPPWWKINKYWSGTEWEACTYPPWQWFMKGIPLYDVSNQHIRTSTQVSVKIKLVLEGKIRKSAYFCPTYGPISGQQLYYQGNERLIYQPGCIRYRTGGRRRTWQNLISEFKYDGTDASSNQTVNMNNLKTHPRLDAYQFKMNAVANERDSKLRYDQKHRIGGMEDIVGANRAIKEPMEKIVVRWSRDTDETEIIMEEQEEESSV